MTMMQWLGLVAFVVAGVALWRRHQEKRAAALRAQIDHQ